MVALQTAQPTLHPDEILTTLIASHGDIKLAAERLHTTPAFIYEAIPDLDYTKLIAGVKAARLLHTFNALTVMQDVVFTTLAELSPESRAKFMIQFMDRLELMVAPPPPPVQGASFQLNQLFGADSDDNAPRRALHARIVEVTKSGPTEDLRRNPNASASDDDSL